MLNGGVNTFKVKYKENNANHGSMSNMRYVRMIMHVPLGQIHLQDLDILF